MKQLYILLATFFLSTISMDAQSSLTYAICFDGVNDFAPFYRSGRTDIFGDNSNGDSFTIEFWTRYQSSGKYLFSKHYIDGSGNKEGYFIERTPTGTIKAGIANTNNEWSTVESSIIVSVGNWHHIAFTYNAATKAIKLYIDGNSQDDLYEVNAVFGNNVDARVASSEYENVFAEASYDEIKVWNIARTVQEVNHFKNIEADVNHANLISYYKCNEGIPDADNWILYQLVDSSTNGVNTSLDLWNVFRLGACSNWVHSVTEGLLSVNSFENPATAFSLYPNPANDFIKIKGLKTEEPYTIYNTLGAIVKKGIISDDTQVQITDLAKGMYFLKLQDNSTIKFIKK